MKSSFDLELGPQIISPKTKFHVYGCCLSFNFIFSWLIAAWGFWDLTVKMIIPVEKFFFPSKIRLMLIYLLVFFLFNEITVDLPRERKKEKTQDNSVKGIEYWYMSCLWAFLLFFISLNIFVYFLLWVATGGVG